jgi:hypothetical protein
MDAEAFVTYESQGRRIREAGYEPPKAVDIPQPVKKSAPVIAEPQGPTHIIVCEICREKIAMVREAVVPLQFPMDGSMFIGPLPGRTPAPWDKRLTWIDMRCPVCHNKPFLYEDRVLTTEGYYDLPISEAWVGEKCWCGRPMLKLTGAEPRCRNHGKIKFVYYVNPESVGLQPVDEENEITIRTVVTDDDSKIGLTITPIPEIAHAQETGQEVTHCPDCGKPVKGEAGLWGHKRHCKGKEKA